MISLLKLNIFQPCVSNTCFSATTYFFPLTVISSILVKISKGSQKVRREHIYIYIYICSLPPPDKDREVSGSVLFLASWLYIGLLGTNGLWLVQHVDSKRFLNMELELGKSIFDKNLYTYIHTTYEPLKIDKLSKKLALRTKFNISSSVLGQAL